MMIEPTKRISIKVLETQILSLLEIINDTNELIKASKKINDDFNVRQYTYLKNKFFKELEDLLKANRSVPISFKKAA